VPNVTHVSVKFFNYSGGIGWIAGDIDPKIERSQDTDALITVAQIWFDEGYG
jgi:hypothetical protein